MAKVILVCGSTGAGKTTFCHKIGARSKAVVFSIDEWMAGLFAADMPAVPSFPWMLERVARCEQLIWKHCLELQEVGVDVILDLGFTTQKQRQAFYQKLKSAGLSSELYYLDVPRETRLSRVLARNQEKGKTFQIHVTEEMFQFIEGIFEAPTEEELSLNNGKRVV